MGRAKDELLKKDEQWEVATRIAVESGVLYRCESHSEVVLDPLSGDHDPAYELGTSQLSDGKFEGLFSNQDELRKIINDVIESAYHKCNYCDRG
jgi:hypothetical protein